MGLWVPPVAFNASESSYPTPAATIGTTITAGGAANTKNSTYTELITSTAFDAYWVEILFASVATAATRTNMLVDIAIGAAASETVIIPNLQAGYAAAIGLTNGGQKYAFPLFIPAGSRISATAQATIASDTVRCILRTRGKPSMPVWAGQYVLAYGVDLVTSLGVPVTTGQLAEGAWTEIVASTTVNHDYIAAGMGAHTSTNITNYYEHLDVGIGAATETEVITNGVFTTEDIEAIRMWDPIGGFVDVPAGSRLSARSFANDTNGATVNDVILYGVS